MVPLLLTLLAVASAQDNSSTAQVQTQHGTIVGFTRSSPGGGDFDVFLGVPFAEPPVGPKRFANPEFYGEFPNGTWVADRYGDSCYQWNYEYLPYSEDCLCLNVWRPHPHKENRAVMVWIYGGSFIYGSSVWNNGAVLSTFGDVIVVTLNYRLGIFGFFHTGDDRMANGNQALLDQQMALRWVHENIASFGGDPRRVTVFGQSAGAVGANHQLLLTGSDPYFSNAIMQSGDAVCYWGAQSLETVAAAAEWISNRTGCPNDDEFVDCLREIPAEDLDSMTSQPYGTPLYFLYSPVVDGVTIADAPLRMMRSGQAFRKDVMFGFTKDEGSYFIFDYPDVNSVNLITEPYRIYATVAEKHFAVLQNLTEPELLDVLAGYLPSDENGYNKAKISISDMTGDVAYVCPTQQAARALDDHGSKVYVYYLTFRSSISGSYEWQGVGHGDDLQWVFGKPFFHDYGYPDDEKQFSEEIMTQWTNFAKYGSPDPAWPSYSSAGGAAHAELRGPGDVLYVTGEEIRGDFCDLWKFD